MRSAYALACRCQCRDQPAPSRKGNVALERSLRSGQAGYYRRIDALQAYIIVSHDREQIELNARTDGGWHLREATTGGQLRIPSLNISLGVDGVYRDPLGGSLARPGEVA